MQPLPHHYTVSAVADDEGEVALQTANVSPLGSTPPAEFGGPGDRWSPETLVVAAVADCFILTFRSLARAYDLPWVSLTCETTGTLDRVERLTQFTHFRSRVRLHLPLMASKEQASHLLALAEERCLITNSLKARLHLDSEIVVSAGPDVIATAGIGGHHGSEQ